MKRQSFSMVILLSSIMAMIFAGGTATNLQADEAQRLVPLIGGREKVLDATQAALVKKGYAWATKLANQLYLIENQDKDARQLKANALRQMACVASARLGGENNDRSSHPAATRIHCRDPGPGSISVRPCQKI